MHAAIERKRAWVPGSRVTREGGQWSAGKIEMMQKIKKQRKPVGIGLPLLWYLKLVVAYCPPWWEGLDKTGRVNYRIILLGVVSNYFLVPP